MKEYYITKDVQGLDGHVYPKQKVVHRTGGINNNQDFYYVLDSHAIETGVDENHKEFEGYKVEIFPDLLEYRVDWLEEINNGMIAQLPEGLLLSRNGVVQSDAFELNYGKLYEIIEALNKLIGEKQ